MLFRINGYKGTYRLVKVARSKDVCLDLLQNQYEVAYVDNDKIIFWPHKYEVHLTENESQKAQLLLDYDIVEINNLGVLYRLYTCSEGDTTIVITPRCNSNCIMCPASERERHCVKDNDLHNIEKLIEYLPDNIYNLVVTGGEPTLAKENFLKVMERLKQKFLFTKVLLLTNGRSLSNNRFFEQFKESSPRDIRIAIPLHGHEEKLHDQITQVPGSFAQTLKGIINLLQADYKVEIRVVVSKVNCDYLTDISDFICKNLTGILCVNFVGLEVRGNCSKNIPDVFVDYDVSAKKIYPAVNILVENGFDVGIYNYPLCLIDNRYWSIAAKSIASYKSKFYEKCDLCDVKENCCGIFHATKAVIKPEVYPIISRIRGCI